MSATAQMTAAPLPERVTVKLYFAEGAAVASSLFVDVFHRFIQQSRLGGLLIDVHDYTHVGRGPGVMLVAHEAHYRVAHTDSDGRPGLLYARKRALSGDWSARLDTVFGAAFAAAVALEEAPQLAGKVRFDTSELLLRIDDRLYAPNDADTAAALEPLLRPDCERILGPTRITWVEGSRAPFALRLVPEEPRALGALVERLETGQS